MNGAARPLPAAADSLFDMLDFGGGGSATPVEPEVSDLNNRYIHFVRILLTVI